MVFIIYRLIAVIAMIYMMVPMPSLAEDQINPANYPSLDQKQIGHLRHFLKLSRQLPGDWSEMGDNWFETPEGSIRYQLANMIYTAASTQFNITPAYRDLYKEIIDSFIQKLLLPDNWREWVNVSRGGARSNPDQVGLLESEFDPMKKDNIMYKGHVLHSAALYETLYREGKYTKPGALSLEWVEATWGPGRMMFDYDLGKLAAIVHKEFKDYGYAGIPCEPNIIFPECPQHGLLGLMLYDKLTGTANAVEIMPRYLEQWQKRGYLSAETGSYMYAYLIQQDKVVERPSAWADAWTGMFMHVWAPEYVKEYYPR